MARQGARIEKVIATLREVEILVNQGSTVAEACRRANVTEHTYCRWRRQYGGLRMDQSGSHKYSPQEACSNPGIAYFWAMPGTRKRTFPSRGATGEAA